LPRQVLLCAFALKSSSLTAWIRLNATGRREGGVVQFHLAEQQRLNDANWLSHDPNIQLLETRLEDFLVLIRI
jgi:hypothetical protein